MIAKVQSADKLPDRSHVLSMLEAIEQINFLCQDVLNTYAHTSLMLSLLVESQMLVMKLRVMRERWKYHLPFREACMVEFNRWSHKTEKMAAGFAVKVKPGNHSAGEYCPSKHFLLDFYCLLPENAGTEDTPPYYKETITSRFVVHQELLRKQINEQWASYYRQRYSDLVVREIGNTRGIDLQSLQPDTPSIRKACHDVLVELSEELALLNEMQEPDIQPDQFARLADRVFSESDYDGRQARATARMYVKAWRNKTPKRRIEQSCRQEIESSINHIREQKYGTVLADYIGDDYDIKEHSEGVGQFLHHVRSRITSSELTELMEQLYRIRFFRENREQQDRASAPQPFTDPFSAWGTRENPVREEEPATTLPQRPRLPYFFREVLLQDSSAARRFYDTLHQVERYMNGRLSQEEKNQIDFKLYRKWKWNHLRVAFINLGFIEKDTPKQHFANFIHHVFPNIKEPSIIRSIQRYNENASGFDRIVREIVHEFEASVLSQ